MMEEIEWINPKMGDMHVMPINDLVDHTSNRTCWCQPELLELCPICGGESNEGCWNCEDGTVDWIGAEEAIVVHNAVDGRE